MAQTVAQIEARLTEVRAAISALLGGAKSYSISGRSVTREDLPNLEAHEDWLESKLSRASNATGSGILFISDTSGWSGE